MVLNLLLSLVKSFKNCFSPHTMKVSGASGWADVKAAEEFLKIIDLGNYRKKLILEGNDLPKQLFNLGRTTLFCKWMLARTFIHKEAKSVPGFRFLRTG